MSCTWFYVGRIVEGDTGVDCDFSRRNRTKSSSSWRVSDGWNMLLYMYLPYKTDAPVHCWVAKLGIFFQQFPVSSDGMAGSSWLNDPIRDENSPLYHDTLPSLGFFSPALVGSCREEAAGLVSSWVMPCADDARLFQYTTAFHWAITQMTPGSMQAVLCWVLGLKDVIKGMCRYTVKLYSQIMSRKQIIWLSCGACLWTSQMYGWQFQWQLRWRPVMSNEFFLAKPRARSFPGIRQCLREDPGRGSLIFPQCKGPSQTWSCWITIVNDHDSWYSMIFYGMLTGTSEATTLKQTIPTLTNTSYSVWFERWA